MKIDFNKLKSSDPMTKKLIKFTIIGFIAIISAIVVLILIKMLFFNKISANKLEEKIEIAARKYYNEYPELLPEQDKETTSITIQQLVDNGKLKSLDKLLKEKDATCQGQVTVTRNSNYFLYSPYVDCGSLYKTKKLYEEITSSKNIVTEKDGLYKIDNKYIYRGEKVNNYLKFANKTWRILSVDGEDNTIRILQEKSTDEETSWDDRYNYERKDEIGINEYDTSRIKDTLNDIWASTKIFSNQEKAYIVTKPLCTAPRSKNEIDKSSNVECRITYGEQALSLMLPSDYLMASLDKQCLKTMDSSCSNYNYLYTDDYQYYWSVTPDEDSSYQSYAFSPTIVLNKSSKKNKIKLVVNLSHEVIYLQGDGSKENPYIIK